MELCRDERFVERIDVIILFVQSEMFDNSLSNEGEGVGVWSKSKRMF